MEKWEQTRPTFENSLKFHAKAKKGGGTERMGAMSNKRIKFKIKYQNNPLQTQKGQLFSKNNDD